MANLRELLVQTRDLLDERESSTQWKDYQLRRWLDEAQRDFVMRALGAGKKNAVIECLEKTSGTSVNGTADYTLPTDFIALETAYLNSIVCREVKVASPYMASLHAFGPSTSDPECALVDSGQIRFYPTPGSTTPAYAIYYWQRPGSLFQQVATFESSEAWTTTDWTKTSSNLTGNSVADSEEENTAYGIKVTATDADTQTTTLTPATALNLGAETDSYVEMFFYCSATTNITSVSVEFHTTDTTKLYAYTWTTAATPLAANGMYLRALKSDFTKTSTADWTSIAKIYLKVVTGGNVAAQNPTVDDLRIYRSPLIEEAAHGLLPLFAAARALQSDEGMRQQGEAANLMLDYSEKVKAYLGG